ncbi:hypothetical protein H5410_003654 [Solanum commersonii]|uniref:Uncharacterized protein n=1 Tax=Solanum commersonii TaxID=4109 RepID=A0A9J6B5I0_SOLCO|nr:hypothetical protein H5410_003654 [Solanum commersonii]
MRDSRTDGLHKLWRILQTVDRFVDHTTKLQESLAKDGCMGDFYGHCKPYRGTKGQRLDNFASTGREDFTSIDILKILPAKSLIRLKCVSKSLYSLINDPDFIFIHYNYDSLSNHFILLKRYVKIEESTNSIYYNGMCNGIVCIASYREIVLSNPTLREFWEFPPSILPPPVHLSPTKELPYLVNMTVGIGFDTNTNDYKVVRILDPGHEYEFEDFDNNRKHLSKVEVYNLSTNSWRKLEDLECLPIIGVDILRKMVIASLLLISIPICSKNFHIQMVYLGKEERVSVLNQTLALIHFTLNFPQEVLVDQSIDIWVMKKYGDRESWVKELIVGPILIRTPLSVWKNETELTIESRDGKLVSCNLLFHAMKGLHMSCVPNTWEAMVCKESLISIKKERDKWS